MERFFYRSTLSLAIAAALFSSATLAGVERIDDTRTIIGESGVVYGDVIREYSGLNGYNKMEIHDYDIVNFQQGTGFRGLLIEAAVSLGGGNGSVLGAPGQQKYGNLSLGFYNSSVKGIITPLANKGNQWMGLYSRTDSDNATVEIKSNSRIELEVINGSNNVNGSGIYSENYGEEGHSHVELLAGSDIKINMTGTGQTEAMNSGAFAFAGNGSTQMIAEEGTTITTHGVGMDGIKSVSRDSALIINAGKINNNGDKSKGVHSHTNPGAPGLGVVNIANLKNATIDVTGEDSYGIFAFSFGKGGMNIYNSGAINVAGANSEGIVANAAYNGANSSEEDMGIRIFNSGTISTTDGSAITASGAHRETWVVNTGDIHVGSENSVEPRYGIYASNAGGLAAVNHAKGLLKATGNSIGIATNGGGSQQIVLGAGSHIDASKGVGGLQMSGNSEGSIVIGKGATVTGGSADVDGFGAKYVGAVTRDVASSDFMLENAGLLGAMSDLAFVADNAAGHEITLNNYGDITGYLRTDGGNISLNNYDTLNLRSFADRNGDQIRDTKQVAMMHFGEGENVINNATGALIQLAEVSGESDVDAAGLFISQGSKSITTYGINQGQMLGVNQFNNAGTLNLALNQLAGDVLAITNNNSMDGQSVHDGGSITSGGGKFISDGGKLILDTVMNEGGKASQSDVLVVDNASKGSGTTTIVINNVGGKGTITKQDGIQIVNVLGDASRDAFTLAGGTVRAGVYEYTLEQGALSDPTNQSFYLRTNSQQINPDLGSYLSNQTMATGLFMHSLHDRLGEPQYIQRYKGDEREHPGMWLRGVASNSKMDAAGRMLSQNINSRVLHLGGDLTRWDDDNGDRYHLGVMGAYGRADTVSKSKKTGSTSRSKVDGYGAGAYLTWYNNAEQLEGWYADLWGMYNWFKNTADSAKDYDSRSWVVSLESGHASMLKSFEQWRWMLEPQGQVSYAHYSADSISDKNGMEIGNEDANGVSTRLGLRTYLQPTAPNDKAKFQPFLTVNWLWNNAGNSMDFNGATFSSDMPKNRFEAKLGLQAEVRKDFHIYGQISGQVGENNYSHKSGQLGLRYHF